jgi:hypothetical protein
MTATIEKFRETIGPCETSEALARRRAAVKSCDDEVEALKSFEFPALKPVIEAHLRPSRTVREIVKLLADPAIRAAVCGPDIPDSAT